VQHFGGRSAKKIKKNGTWFEGRKFKITKYSQKKLSFKQQGKLGGGRDLGVGRNGVGEFGGRNTRKGPFTKRWGVHEE